MRVLIVATVSVLLLLFVDYIGWVLSCQAYGVVGRCYSDVVQPGLILTEALLYFLLPVIVIAACLPTTIVAYLFTLMTLRKAQQKIRDTQPQIIGVGGSYGKTSTKHLLAHVLAQK